MQTTQNRNVRDEQEAKPSTPERVYGSVEHERHYAPLNRELHPDEAMQFGWKAETGTIQSYVHLETHRHIHIDGPTGQFYDQQKTPLTREAALDGTMGTSHHHANEHSRSSQQTTHTNNANSQELGIQEPGGRRPKLLPHQPN